MCTLDGSDTVFAFWKKYILLHCSLELVHSVQIFYHTFTVSMSLIAYHIHVSYRCRTRGPCKYYMLCQLAMKLEKLARRAV